MNRITSQTGHDAPIADRAEDFYDRWPVAKSISRIIATAPSKWSTRIGLFAPWGDGKTSVLNFVEQQQLEAGNIVIRYTPWGASTPDEVWKDFGKVLIAGLQRNGVKVRWWAAPIHWVKSFGVEKVKAAIKALGKMIESSGHAPGASVGANVASMLLSKKLTFSSKDMLRVTDQLGDRRVVVFIDDLDRAAPAVVPKLLLVLRELLDYKQFAFVLAFDRKVVATALEQSNEAWGKEGETFLDKVIDFRVDLPQPTADQVRRLGLFQFGALCSFVPRESVDAIVKLLPSNPRKLKLFVRMIASMQKEVERHEDAELDWGVILLLALVRTESEGLASRLLENTIGNVEYDFMEGYEEAEDKNARRARELDLLLKEFPELVPRTARVQRLIEAWRAEMPRHPGERVRYQASFALAPHSITWSEFKQFFAKWQADRRASVIANFLAEQEKESEARAETVQSELAETIVSHYGTILENASHFNLKVGHQSQLSHAADALDLLLQSVGGTAPVCALTPEQLSKLWERLYGLALEWCHFDANESDAQLRIKERQTLIELGKATGDHMPIYEMLKPGQSHEDVFDGRSTKLKNALSDALRQVFEPQACAVALSYVKTPGEIRRLRSRGERRAARYLLTTPSSPMFTTHKTDLLEAWTGRRNTSEAVSDASEYLSLLLRAIGHGDQEYCTSEERKVFIKAHSDLMGMIWNLSVSEPSQFRMLQDLRKQRDLLVDLGVPVSDLDMPDWLKSQSAIPLLKNE
ncbi:P-loop NTPase fold protein [Rhodoferax sp. TS-BS-61-7]|uniref:P-loop NTPase fold protein n=1 Tax=Rhodoferax sp. TS-BS-61-7 TaxID=2094194 RepID=UPI000CF65AED|nr:P-loop NTPase fold protein [Rhodoferax sp. TS-BS-61-7]PQA77527.1 hypothetical protein C5F53_09820 [Rhodoferax sp. TS-BS-61-7]